MPVKKHLYDIAKAATILFIAVLTVIFPSETASSTVNSINVCISSIIPSMFAFMVITSYIQSSGLYRIIFKPLLPVLRHIVHADDSILSVFLLSMLGGYPIGIKLLRETIAQNKNSPAIVSSCGSSAMFCYCVSPSFALIMIGNGIFGSTSAGAVIYISNVLSCIAAAAVISRIYDLREPVKHDAVKGRITDAINSASRALFTVCTVIVAFNIALTCVKRLLELSGITLTPLICGILEISNLLNIENPTAALIPIVSAISSFGGACVLVQCVAIAGNAFPVRKFLAARLPCAFLSALISSVILMFADISVTASTYSPQYTYDFSADKVIVLVLIAMCIIIFNKSDKFFGRV